MEAALLPAAAAASPDAVRELCRERIEQAKEGRRPYEGGILSDLAFAAGQHWLVYDDQGRRMRHIAEVDPRYQERELFTADRLSEYRDAILGELNGDDDRQELVTAQDGPAAEAAAVELNQAVAHAWEREWGADDVLRQARRYTVDMGVAAIRCRWDKGRGEVTGHAPIGVDGAPVTDPAAISHLLETGQLPDGSLPRFQPVKEGATSLEAYSALHLLPQPGVVHENDLQWQVLARPVPIESLRGLYPDVVVDGLREDTDIASLAGVTTGQQGRSGQLASQARLRGHVWLYSYFEQPTMRWPDGRVVVLASNQYTLLDIRPQLDYRDEEGRPHSGIVYLHWRRRSDRFWSGSFISNLKDPQRIINRRETQNVEIIDRHMPRHYLEKGSLEEEPTGAPGELVYMDKGANPPQFFQGAGPGPWMYEDLAHQADNLSHASTLSPLRLGENPQNVDTYSQLALLNENEQVKRSEARLEHQAAIGSLIMLGVADIQRYWPEQKKILVHGDDEQVRQATFEKARIPALYMVKPATGAPAPRSEAAELKKIDAIWAAAAQSGAVAGNPNAWIDWYVQSVEARQSLATPEPEQDPQQRMADLENERMRRGDQPQVMDYDLMPAHLPRHRLAMDDARAAGDQATLRRLQVHVEEHIRVAQLNAAKTASAQQTPSPLAAAAAPGNGGGLAAQLPFVGPDLLKLQAGLP